MREPPKKTGAGGARGGSTKRAAGGGARRLPLARGGERPPRAGSPPRTPPAGARAGRRCAEAGRARACAAAACARRLPPFACGRPRRRRDKLRRRPARCAPGAPAPAALRSKSGSKPRPFALDQRPVQRRPDPRRARAAAAGRRAAARPAAFAIKPNKRAVRLNPKPDDAPARLAVKGSRLRRRATRALDCRGSAPAPLLRYRV